MPPSIRPLKPTNNVDFLNGIRNYSSNDYQKRIPAATKANVQDTIRKIYDYTPSRNEFIDALVNKIGLTVAKNTIWSNPLAKFKMGNLAFGDTIEEVMTGLLQAKSYDGNRDYLEGEIFSQEAIESQSSFHKVNRRDYYKLTISEAQLTQAFTSETGLYDFVNNLMNAPTTSDAWDEFLLTCSLFTEYYNDGGFFKVNVPDVSVFGSTASDAKFFLRRVRELADKLPFISRNYNAAHMPVAATRDELELFITPEANAAIDVEALAAAFNEDRANMPMRITVIPKENFNIPGVQAVLTTRDFFVIADQRIEMRNQPNPVGLYDNYFLHHWQVISASRFVPAILFTTEAGTVITGVDTPVTSVAAITVTDDDANDVAITALRRGENYNVNSSGITTPGGGDNNAVRFVLTGALSPRTFLNQAGTIYIAPDEDAISLTITAVAVTDSTKTATATLPVVGPKVEVWPSPRVLEDVDSDALLEVTPKPVPAAPTSGANKNKVTIPTSEGIDYKDGGTTVSGQTITLAANKTITAVAQAGFELATGATASWALVYTP